MGQAAACKAYEALIDLPERAPDALLADKSHDADAIRADLDERDTKAVIPGRSNRRVKIEHDRALHKQRNRRGLPRFLGSLDLLPALGVLEVGPVLLADSAHCVVPDLGVAAELVVEVLVMLIMERGGDEPLGRPGLVPPARQVAVSAIRLRASAESDSLDDDFPQERLP